MFLGRCSANLLRKIDLTHAFKSFFHDISFKLCSKIAGLLGKQRLGCLGGARAHARVRARACARARAHVRARARACQGQEDLGFATDLKRAIDKVRGKSLTQREANLICPTRL